MFTGTEYVNNYCRVKKTYNQRRSWLLIHFKIFDFTPGEKKGEKMWTAHSLHYILCKLRSDLIHSAIHPSFFLAENTDVCSMTATCVHRGDDLDFNTITVRVAIGFRFLTRLLYQASEYIPSTKTQLGKAQWATYCTEFSQVSCMISSSLL